MIDAPGRDAVAPGAAQWHPVTTSIHQRIAEELGVRRAAGAGGGRAARRRGDGAVHRPLPQGGDRHARRRAAAHARGAAALPARAGGAARRRSWSRSARRASSTTRCEAQILAADSKARLEDIYLPYKPKRRTKAQIAREAGLEPLADALLADPSRDPQAAAAAFVDAEQGRRRRRRRAGRRPRDPRRAVRRGRRPDRRAARADVDRAAGWSRKVRDGKEEPRAPSSPTTSTSPSRSPSCPRTGSWRCSAARRRRSST